MQSRLGSFIESVINVLLGFAIATIAQMFIFQAIGQPITLQTSLVVGAFMTLVSIARSYVLRRLFNAITIRRLRAYSHQNP